MIYLASDHAGFQRKNELAAALRQKNIELTDLGPQQFIKGDNYPEYAIKVAEKVAVEKGAKGILVCDSGIGMDITANKVKGVRAALVTDDFQATRSRQHNDANVLVLGSEETSAEKALQLAQIFLTTEFSGEERHERRIEEITEYEEKHD